MKRTVSTIPWALLVIVALALALRLPYLTERSLWFDEASSWQTAKFALPDLFHSVRLNVHLPLYYLLLKVWMMLWGESVPSLRGFSITFGLLTIIAIERFARELYRASSIADPTIPEDTDSRRFALFVAALVALSPYQVFASIEARMYSLGTAFTALGAGLLLRAIRSRESISAWAAYGVSCTALLYCHHYAIFTVAAQFAFLGFFAIWLHGIGGWTEARKILIPAAAAGSAIALAYLPGFQLLSTQTGRVRQDYWIQELSWTTVFATFTEFFIPVHDFSTGHTGWIVLAVLVASAVVVCWNAQRGDALVLASAVLPLFFSAAISTAQPIWVGRYFRFAHLFLLTIVASAVWKLSRGRPWFRFAAVLTLAVVLLGANVEFWNRLDIPSGPGIQGAIAKILEQRTNAEPIVTLEYPQYFPAKYYTAGRARIGLLYPYGRLFWGAHLVRPHDRITRTDLEQSAPEGFWVISRHHFAAIRTFLPQVECLEKYSFTYYHALHRRLFVYHCRRSSQTLQKIKE